MIDWNVIATNAAFAAGKNAIEQSRIYAMTHAAIHDALNAIDRRYKTYALDRRAEPNASPEAAVASAAHDVLVAQLPTQQATLDRALRPAFDICLQDDSSGDVLRIDSSSGEYQFLRYGGNGFTLSGRGELLRAGCVLALVDDKVIAVINHCPVASPDRGHAIVRVSPRGPTFLINDRDVNNNDCVCR